MRTAGVAGMVLGLAIFAAVGVILLGPVAGVVDQNTGDQTVTNETVHADYDQSVDLRGYDLVANSETVWGYNDTSGSYEQATSPDDYTLNDAGGDLSFNSSSSLIEDGEEVKVSYDYQASDTLTTLVVGFIPLGVGLLIFVGVAKRVTGAL